MSDDGIVMVFQTGDMRKLLGRATNLPITIPPEGLRDSILQEERLQRDLARDEELQRNRSDLWRSLEAARRAANHADKAVNARLRALGLKPIRPRMSLSQRRQELRRLHERNVAAIAALRGRLAKSPSASRGTRSARSRSRRADG